MKRKAIIVTSSICLFVFVISGICLLLSNRSNSTTPEIKSQSLDNDFDYAAQAVFENQFINKTNIPLGNNGLEVTGKYFDGIRLYILLSSDVYSLSKKSLEKFILFSDGKEYVPDTIILSEDINLLTNTDHYLLIFNTIGEGNLESIILSYDGESKTNSFYVDNVHADTFISDAFFEEVVLKSIKFGKTSTLIECKINAKIKGDFFQVEVNDMVLPVFVLKNDNWNYTLLLPIDLDKNSKFTLIANNGATVELRVPIDFSNA